MTRAGNTLNLSHARVNQRSPTACSLGDRDARRRVPFDLGTILARAEWVDYQALFSSGQQVRYSNGHADRRAVGLVHATTSSRLPARWADVERLGGEGHFRDTVLAF